MQQDFWINCWQKEHIGFHQDEHQPFLIEYFEHLGGHKGQSVFVPLCGKSSDLLYFSEQLNCQVIGNELSEIACQDFFSDNQLKVTINQQDAFTCYQSGGVTLYQGDFFALKPALLPSFNWVYDRAALIALPLAMREQYAIHLKGFLAENTQLFLITLEFEQNEMKGPPFSVSEQEVNRLFCDRTVRKVASRDLTGKKFSRLQLSVTNLTETLYIIN